MTSDDQVLLEEAPDRRWAQDNLRAYLLGRLPREQQQAVANALFIHSGLSYELEDVEEALMLEFLNGMLHLDPTEQAALKKRWTTPHGRAALELLKIKGALRTAAKPKAPVPIDRPAAIGKFNSGRYIALVASAAAVFTVTVLGYWFLHLQRENGQTTALQVRIQQQEKQIADLNSRYAELEKPAAGQASQDTRPPTKNATEPARLHRDMAAGTTGGKFLPEHSRFGDTFTFPPGETLIWLPPQDLTKSSAGPRVEQFEARLTFTAEANSTDSVLIPLYSDRNAIALHIPEGRSPAWLTVRFRSAGGKSEILLDRLQMVADRQN